MLGSFFFIEWFEKINNIFDFKKIDNSKNFNWFIDELYKQEININVKEEIVYKKIDFKFDKK